ncbi:hypothetical protein DERF_007816 [Dermatophagoides farinae]|uniref:Uncharacterized protein n=1 Tax=Dermatophagoides farinae TaxID=6954 RepID=A0A922L4V4_DERFA|nr:hypothetical protein DERF_007816 [Dermatophagoides farinae]
MIRKKKKNQEEQDGKQLSDVLEELIMMFVIIIIINYQKPDANDDMHVSKHSKHTAEPKSKKLKERE